MSKWNVDTGMAIWAIAFGLLATGTGFLLLSAVEGGFVAEGFFLVVVGWILILVLVAKLVTRIRERRGGA